MSARLDLVALAEMMYVWRRRNRLTQRECDEIMGYSGVWGGIERLRRLETNEDARRAYGDSPSVSTFERICELVLEDEPLSTFWNLWSME